MRRTPRVLALVLFCVAGAAGCAAPMGAEKANWNLFSAWKVDRRSPEKGGPVPAPKTASPAPQQAVAATLAAANDLQRDGHFREAAVLLAKARQLDPQATELTPRLAGLYERLGEAPQARAEYRQALGATPQNADLWNTYGYFEFRQAQFADAEQAFQRALALAPAHALARLNLAQTLANAGRLQEAYDQFAQIQGAAAAHASIGAILAGQGRSVEARAAYANALQVNPQEPAALAFLAHAGQDAIPAAATLPESAPAGQFVR